MGKTEITAEIKDMEILKYKSKNINGKSFILKDWQIFNQIIWKKEKKFKSIKLKMKWELL